MEPAENSRIIKKEIFQAETLSPIKIRGEVNQVHTNYSCRGSGGVIIGVSILYSVLCSLNCSIGSSGLPLVSQFHHSFVTH
jgi:hypothetical protein